MQNNMKIVQSSLFRAVCAIIVGVLLIQYREQTVTWITIAIGVLFFLSGLFSLITYYTSKRYADKHPDQALFDADGRQLTGLQPRFPLVGLGSLLLGLVLALMPTTFMSYLMSLLGCIVILGCIGMFTNLAAARKMGSVGLVYYIFPTLILLVALLAILRPSAVASAPLLILGWLMLIYGVSECISALKVSNNKRRWSRQNSSAASEEIKNIEEIKD